MPSSRTAKSVKVVEEIILHIEKGLTYNKTMRKIVSKYQFTDRTFCRHWKNAFEIHTQRQSERKALLTETEVETRKYHIISAAERKEYLTKVILGEMEITLKRPFWNPEQKKMQMIPVTNPADERTRLSAIAELNRMEGSYAPTKVANTDSEGNDVQPPLSPVQYEKLIELVNKSGGKS
jgi:hypothetical protein